MKYYLLNKWENKIEVYKTVYCPKKINSLGKETFYSDSTLFIYAGSLPLGWKGFNTAACQVELCKNGNVSHYPYYGGRTIGDKFQILDKKEVIAIFKNNNN